MLAVCDADSLLEKDHRQCRAQTRKQHATAHTVCRFIPWPCTISRTSASRCDGRRFSVIANCRDANLPQPALTKL